MKILIAIVLIYVINIYLTFRQMNKYNEKIKKLKKEYPSCYISTGKYQKMFKKGSISILVIDKNGLVKYGELMKGRTVFAKFKEIKNIKNTFVRTAKEKFVTEPAVINAISFYEKLN